jgi:hypothetical protein
MLSRLEEENLGRYSYILREIKTSAMAFVEASFIHENRVSRS